MSRKRIDPSMIKVSVELVRDLYPRPYSNEPDELAALISDEFECICLPEDVTSYCSSDVVLVEEEDAFCIYRNVGLL